MRIAMNKFVQLLGRTAGMTNCPCAICDLPFAICHLRSAICDLPFAILSPHSAFLRPVGPIRHHACGLEIFTTYNALQRITTHYNGLQRITTDFFKKT
jgi:hypothetical protein